MLWHSAANCKVSQIYSVFGIFLRNYWFDLDQTLIFVYAVALCSQLQSFQIFFTFLHISQELLVWSWSNFDFCLCCATLQPTVKFRNFHQFLAFFSGTTGLILIKLWFLFMLWHSTANCKVSKFSSLFCIFLKNYWSSSSFDFCSCCGILQPVVKFHKFLSFWHFSQELLVTSWSNFDFCVWCSTLQFFHLQCLIKFSSLFGIFLRNYWFDLDQTLIFVYALALCSQL